MKMQALYIIVFALLVFALIGGGDADMGASFEGSVSGSGGLRLEDRYAAITIFYTEGPGYLEVKNASLEWGKWVQNVTDLSTEVSSPDGTQMTAWGEYHITATGRAYLPTGCEGSFDLYYNGEERAFYVYFDTNLFGSPEIKVEKFSDNFNMEYITFGDSHIASTIYISWLDDSSLPVSVGDQ